MLFSFILGVFFGMLLMSLILGILFIIRTPGNDHPMTEEEIKNRIKGI